MTRSRGVRSFEAAPTPTPTMAGLLEKLGQIRQVINVFPTKRAGQPKAEQTVLTKRDQTHEKLIEILGLRPPKVAV